MLSAEDVANIRRAALRNQYTGRGGVALDFEDGPLAGLRLRFKPSSAGSMFLGYCTVNETGCWQALYRVGKPCRLERLSRPGQDRGE